jgi:hypothetical protein
MDIGDRGRGEFRMRNYMKVMSAEEPYCYVRHERNLGNHGVVGCFGFPLSFGIVI